MAKTLIEIAHDIRILQVHLQIEYERLQALGIGNHNSYLTDGYQLADDFNRLTQQFYEIVNLMHGATARVASVETEIARRKAAKPAKRETDAPNLFDNR